VLIALCALVVLMIVGPVVAGWISWRRRDRPGAAETQVTQQTSRFMGTQLDLAILVIGLLLLFGLVAWIFRLFRG
jgi:uncharacterized iron-regulated membrane protein